MHISKFYPKFLEPNITFIVSYNSKIGKEGRELAFLSFLWHSIAARNLLDGNIQLEVGEKEESLQRRRNFREKFLGCSSIMLIFFLQISFFYIFSKSNTYPSNYFHNFSKISFLCHNSRIFDTFLELTMTQNIYMCVYRWEGHPNVLWGIRMSRSQNLKDARTIRMYPRPFVCLY